MRTLWHTAIGKQVGRAFAKRKITKQVRDASHAHNLAKKRIGPDNDGQSPRRAWKRETATMVSATYADDGEDPDDDAQQRAQPHVPQGHHAEGRVAARDQDGDARVVQNLGDRGREGTACVDERARESLCGRQVVTP